MVIKYQRDEPSHRESLNWICPEEVKDETREEQKSSLSNKVLWFYQS